MGEQILNDRELLEVAVKALPRERHGMNKSPEHSVWVGMKQRCTNPNKRDYRWYGAKGVKVCEEWMHSFLSFYGHIGAKPTPAHTVDRINVEKGYEPGNVRWATQQEQVENTTVVRMIYLNGKTQSVSAWEREMGLSKGQVKARENNGWTTDAAILTPSVVGQKKLMKRTPQNYSRLKNGTFRVMVAGVYIQTVNTEQEAIALVAASTGSTA